MVVVKSPLRAEAPGPLLVVRADPDSDEGRRLRDLAFREPRAGVILHHALSDDDRARLQERWARDPSAIGMALPQMLVISMLFVWDRPWHALAVTALLALQFAAMRVLFKDPKGKAPWYNATGVSLYVVGMMVTAFAIRTLEISL